MAEPIWRNIQAPSLAGAIQANTNAGQFLQNAVGGASNALSELERAQQTRVDNAATRQALAISDPVAYQQFLATANPNISAAALDRLSQREGTLLNNSRTRQQMDLALQENDRANNQDRRADVTAKEMTRSRDQQYRQGEQQLTQNKYTFNRTVTENNRVDSATRLLQDAVETSGTTNDIIAKISNADVPAEVRNMAMNLLYRTSPNARPGATLPGGVSAGSQPVNAEGGVGSSDPASATGTNALVDQLTVAAGREDFNNLDRNYIGDPVLDLARTISGAGGALEGTNVNYLADQIQSYALEFDVPVDVAAKAIAQGSTEAGFWNSSFRIPFTSIGQNPEIGGGRTLVTSQIENTLKGYKNRDSQRSAVSAEFLRNAANAVQQAQSTYTTKNNIYRDVASRAEGNPKLAAALAKAERDANQAKASLEQAQANYSSLDSNNRYFD